MNVTWLVIRNDEGDFEVPEVVDNEEKAVGFIDGRDDPQWTKAWVGVPLDTRIVDGEVRVRPRGTSLPHTPIHHD